MTRKTQTHHLSYNPPITEKIYQGEHQIITLIQRYSKNTLSKGFIRTLQTWINQNKHRAKEL